MSWLRDFYRFSGSVVPETITDRHLTDYLTYLAAERNVAKSTHGRKSSCGITSTPPHCKKASNRRPTKPEFPNG
jgi:hypothetical protein